VKSALSVEQSAKALGVSRRTLSTWRRRYKGKCPDLGNVEAWRAFMRERGLGQYSLRLNAPDGGGERPEDSQSERELRLAERRVRLEREQFELAKAIEQTIPISQVQAALAAMVGAFNATLNAMPGRAALKVIDRARVAFLDAVRDLLTEKQFEKLEAALNSAQIDYADVEEVIRAEVDLAKRTLCECDYLQKGGASPQ
jgi:hypothetical protein